MKTYVLKKEKQFLYQDFSSNQVLILLLIIETFIIDIETLMFITKK